MKLHQLFIDYNIIAFLRELNGDENLSVLLAPKRTGDLN